MKVAVPAESVPGERRVALVPDAVGPLVEAGLQVLVQSRAGVHALATDADYTDAGADVVTAVDAEQVDVLLHVRPLRPQAVGKLRAGAITIGMCAAAEELATVQAMRDGRITAFAMELVPRISRAQSMDALTSQALVAGYRCVLEAAMRLPRFFPLFMTAAGTVPPAKVLVLGAGVAGLQAIATARRLGAVVSGYDVRPGSADEVRSMGATFVQLELESLEGAGGYAREMTEERAARQRELLAPHVAASDVVITTAAVPGRRAPVLLSTDMVAGMRNGSVVIDLAAESGGNVAGGLPGEDLEVPVAVGDGAVRLVGMRDAASTMPADASRLYSRNVITLLLLMTGRGKDGSGEVLPDFDDEVVAGACLTHDGVVRHQPTAALLAAGQQSDPGPPDGRRRAAGDLRAGRVRRVRGGPKVSTTLHTPLMSGANAIHGIILVGAVLVAGGAESPAALAVGLVAIVLATMNLVGGFVVTDRMLEMFKGRDRPGRGGGERAEPDRSSVALPGRGGVLHPRPEGAVLAPHRAPREPARRARGRARAGGRVRVHRPARTCPVILIAIVVGSALAVPVARRVQMTQMPQLVALFNGVGGGAAALVALLELGEVGDARLVARWRPSRSPCSSGRCRFAGSAVTFAKLQELMTTRPVVLPGARWLMIGSLAAWSRSLAYSGADRGGVRGRAAGAGRAGGRGAARAAGRRRRRADRDLAAERVHRPGRRRRRLRARQHAAAGRRAPWSGPAARS